MPTGSREQCEEEGEEEEEVVVGVGFSGLGTMTNMGRIPPLSYWYQFHVMRTMVTMTLLLRASG